MRNYFQLIQAYTGLIKEYQKDVDEYFKLYIKESKLSFMKDIVIYILCCVIVGLIIHN